MGNKAEVKIGIVNLPDLNRNIETKIWIMNRTWNISLHFFLFLDEKMRE